MFKKINLNLNFALLFLQVFTKITKEPDISLEHLFL